MAAVSPAITACTLARNEERRIEAALQSLQGWTDQILVIDNESEDRTVEIARRYTEQILTAPRAANFDALRNLAIEHATGDWIFFLDADERVSPRLGPELRRLVIEQGHEFEALLIPFKHYFCGEWIRHSGWSPGYTRPQLLKKGRFHYNERLHSGVTVDGRTLFFPADDPDLAIVHLSYDDLHHYLEKLNRYTDGEAESLLADNGSHSWQAMLAHLVHDWQAYYERGRGDQDGMHGFVLAFMAGIYRFISRAKLWDLRTNTKTRRREADREQEVGRTVEAVPADLREMLEFMARVAQEGAGRWLDPPENSSGTFASSGLRVNPEELVPLLWHAPLMDPSGYADEARNFVLGLLDAGESLALAPAHWGDAEAGLSAGVRARIEAHTAPIDTPAELFVCHTLLALQQPSPHARFNIARTMFETDRLPPGAAEALNRFDRVWVPSEFNRETFVRSGVEPAKIVVVPGAIDPAPFSEAVEPWPLPGQEKFRFLSLFDWTLHKGWDVLLAAFAREFGRGYSPPRSPAGAGTRDTENGLEGSDGPGGESVGLVLKVWSSNGYSLDDIRGQADAYLKERVGRGLDGFPNIHLWQEQIPTDQMPRLYRAVDAFVLPTRGEGWCRPLMEAMAAGLPTIATSWSGLTAFHSARVGYPLKYQLVPVSAQGATEIPVYAGHCWAEPDEAELRRLMRRLVAHPDEAGKRGEAARKAIRRHYSRPAVAALARAELARCRELASAVRGTPSAVAGNGRQPANPAASVPSPPATSMRQEGRPAVPVSPAPNRLSRSPAPPVDFRALLGRPLRVRWEGDQFLLSSLALVNRELCLGLLASGDIELQLVEVPTPWPRFSPAHDPRLGQLFARREAVLSGPPDVTVRHHFPPCWERPPAVRGSAAGKLVVVQPWEYGYLPRDWVVGARQHADEAWAYSRFVRDVYVRSGVPAEKVRVVPLGYNPAVFTPEGPQYPLPTQKSVRFLFVGGALERKGADLLLESYRQVFMRHDDVSLVVKDHPPSAGTRDAHFLPGPDARRRLPAGRGRSRRARDPVPG